MMGFMSENKFPLEKIFGSRTRVKIITLFTTGVKRPYFVREIARNVNERLNAVRRELDILQKVGMLESHMNKRKKYYSVNPQFPLIHELSSIMHKAGPAIEDTLFKNIDKIGDIQYACVTGFFTGAHDAPTDLFIIGNVNEKRLAAFMQRIELELNRELTYTPMTESEYTYRKNFNDMFLRKVFANSHKEILNKLEPHLQPAFAKDGV